MYSLVIRSILPALTSAGCIAFGCGEELAEDQRSSGVSAVREELPADDRVAARVDGVPITVEEVQGLIDDADGGLGPVQALDALVRRQLLAAEAERRGYGASDDVTVERRKALARALLDRQAAEVTVDTLDQERLRAVYESRLEQFVHGPERRVIHAVARTGEKRWSSERAHEVIDQVRRAVGEATTEEEFRAAARPLVKAHGKKRLKVETLPPFHAGSRRLAAPFVEAAFAVPGPGHVTEPFQTKFGWHVLLVIEELPAADVPFEEARQIIGAEVVPLEQHRKVESLVEELRSKAGVFVYGDGAASGDRTP
jgi:hypothetical protein